MSCHAMNLKVYQTRDEIEDLTESIYQFHEPELLPKRISISTFETVGISHLSILTLLHVEKLINYIHICIEFANLLLCLCLSVSLFLRQYRLNFNEISIKLKLSLQGMSIHKQFLFVKFRTVRMTKNDSFPKRLIHWILDSNCWK